VASGNAPYFIIFTLSNARLVTRQGESAAIQRGYSDYLPMHPVNPLSGNAPTDNSCIITICMLSSQILYHRDTILLLFIFKGHWKNFTTHPAIHEYVQYSSHFDQTICYIEC
jgi:hypothetical protein